MPSDLARVFNERPESRVFHVDENAGDGGNDDDDNDDDGGDNGVASRLSRNNVWRDILRVYVMSN